jgi:hypothetical protein
MRQKRARYGDPLKTKELNIFENKNLYQYYMTEFQQTFGSQLQVWNGTAKKTKGGNTKKDLMKTKHGRIVSRKKHAQGLKAVQRLRRLGYVAKKGKFTLFRKQ